MSKHTARHKQARAKHTEQMMSRGATHLEGKQMEYAKKLAKRGASLFTLLGITMSIGAVIHGNEPAMSIGFAIGWLGVLIALNI